MSTFFQATIRFSRMNLFSPQPILGADHPAHAYRVEIYRQALWQGGLPWGYDPSIGAGTVLRPTRDAGAKPQQVLGVILPWASGGTIVKGFLFVALLTFPIWVLLTSRSLGLEPYEQLWAVAIALATIWLYENFLGFFRWGLAAFALSIFVAPLALALVVKFDKSPNRKLLVWSAVLIALVLFLHVLGPLLIAPAMIAVIALSPRLPIRWKAAAFGAAAVAVGVNCFWLIPFASDFGTPRQPLVDMQFYPKDLTYLSWDHLLDMLSPARMAAAVVGLSLAGYGLWLLRRRAGPVAAIAFGSAAFLGVFLKFFGSFIPVIVATQPSRFLIAAFALMAIPAGMSLAHLTRMVRLPQPMAIVAFVVLLVAAAGVWRSPESGGRTHINFAGVEEMERATFLALPQPVPQPAGFDELTEFVRRNTKPSDRILIQTRIQAEQTILASVWDRELIGNCYPDVADPTNFVLASLWGRKLKEWTEPQLREALERWGVSYVITCNEPARDLMQRAIGRQGVPMAQHEVFATDFRGDRLLQGEGRTEAWVNRINVDARPGASGDIVLRYRYHPAWTADDGVEVFQFPVAEDPAGFIGLRNVRSSVSLRFDFARLFTAKWPEATGRVAVVATSNLDD